ncbi:hypothetical protein A6U86_29455 [Rhizobium sp. AC27/96]|uniref:hypothetical protein n=1 Tax=Rhizobium sp. AC27/96 TaxID=1841653 RepID=UPI0008276FE9|nr:hypothetical protein [Rhizobium sp. AC27/96]OCJ05387.1 hypothetical protein A6U86_29455 [Rhizobium sp. AC27/96]
MDDMLPHFDLTSWYINQRRVLELVGHDAVAGGFTLAKIQPTENLKVIAINSAFQDALTRWLDEREPKTLGQLVILDDIAPGRIFTCYTNWFFKGLSEVSKAIERGATLVPPAIAYAKLDDFRQGWKIECRFQHEHFTARSSWNELRGQKRLIVVGLITDVKDTTIEAVPYVIANPAPSWDKPQSAIGKFWINRLECFVDQIETFQAVRGNEARMTKNDLKRLEGVSEHEVKRAFAEIIGEPTVPKDWGGERSDLFTTRLVIDGQRISAAFAFKGPAQFKPMTMKELGKNGDQIDRLFSEPADILLLQHCHEITGPVRGAMRAYAQQMGNPRIFCLIDGYDTIRILQAYGKCGFG